MLWYLMYLVCVLCSVFVYYFIFYVFFFKQKTAYEMRISDWSSDVCSSDPSIAACIAAKGVDPDSSWRAEAERAFAWFLGANDLGKIGRASCRERVCKYV